MVKPFTFAKHEKKGVVPCLDAKCESADDKYKCQFEYKRERNLFKNLLNFRVNKVIKTNIVEMQVYIT